MTAYHATSKVQIWYQNDDRFRCFNNLLETAATPQQHPQNVLVTNIPEPRTFQGRTPETFSDIHCTRSTKKSKIVKIQTGVKNWSRRAEYIRQHRQSLLLDTQPRKSKMSRQPRKLFLPQPKLQRLKKTQLRRPTCQPVYSNSQTKRNIEDVHIPRSTIHRQKHPTNINASSLNMSFVIDISINQTL